MDKKNNMSSKTSNKWDQKSDDGKKLEKMFADREIATDATAAAIRNGNKEWVRKYTSQQFCNAFNRLKKNYGLSTFPDKLDEQKKGKFYWLIVF